MEEVMTIEEIKKSYPNEWILVDVVEEDGLERPIRGRLIAHSTSRDEIHEIMKEHNGYVYLFFNGDIPKKGFAFCF